MPQLATLIAGCHLTDNLDVSLLLKILFDEVFVLERSVIKTFHKVFSIDVLKCTLLVKFVVLKLLQLAIETLLETEKEISLKRLMHQDWKQILVSFFPEVHVWL
jgi:hypothetical protein